MAGFRPIKLHCHRSAVAGATVVLRKSEAILRRGSHLLQPATIDSQGGGLACIVAAALLKV
jgi:hypothetical protein